MQKKWRLIFYALVHFDPASVCRVCHYGVLRITAVSCPTGA